jgi:hypothetical protein
MTDGLDLDLDALDDLGAPAPPCGYDESDRNRPRWHSCPDCTGYADTCNQGHRHWRANRGHCKVCHQTFANDDTSERHRVGPHDSREGIRRCLTTDELLALGWTNDNTDDDAPSTFWRMGDDK